MRAVCTSALVVESLAAPVCIISSRQMSLYWVDGWRYLMMVDDVITSGRITPDDADDVDMKPRSSDALSLSL